MPSFSINGAARLATCHPDLIRLFQSVVADVDCSILVGHRGRVDQEKAFQEGHSRAHFGESLHNYLPALAVDVAPFPINWENIQRFNDFAAFVLKRADELKIPVRWGGTFKGLADLDHFELVGYVGTLPAGE